MGIHEKRIRQIRIGSTRMRKTAKGGGVTWKSITRPT